MFNTRINNKNIYVNKFSLFVILEGKKKPLSTNNIVILQQIIFLIYIFFYCLNMMSLRGRETLFGGIKKIRISFTVIYTMCWEIYCIINY